MKFLLYDKCPHTQTYIFWHSIHYNYLFFLSAAARKASKKSIPFETIKREVLDVLRLLPTNLEEPTMLKYVHLYWITCLWHCYHNCINDVPIVWPLMVINVCIAEKRRRTTKSWWFSGGIGLRITEHYYGILYPTHQVYFLCDF